MKKNNRSRFSYFINPGENSTGGGHLGYYSRKNRISRTNRRGEKDN